MALEDLTKRILDDAEESAERIVKTAREAAQKIEHEALEEEKALRASYARATEELRAKSKTLAHEKAAHEARVMVESAQRELLDATFAQALDRAVQATGDAYRALLRAPLARIAEDKDAITVVYAPRDRVEETKEALAAAGITVPVEVRESIRGGLVAAGPACEYDVRFEQTLAQVQRTIEADVAPMLLSA